MDELFALLLLALWLPQFRRCVLIDRARTENDRARDALNGWIATHPDCSLASPRAQTLIRERLTAWNAYVKACPVLGDHGVLERYLRAYLEEPADAPAPYPMP